MGSGVEAPTCPSCSEQVSQQFNFCPYCGIALTPAAHRAIRKTITVLFCDLKGSTTLGESLDWRLLLDNFGAHWRLIFSQILLFGFCYPSERDKVPAC